VASPGPAPHGPVPAQALRRAARRFGTPAYVTDGAVLDGAADALAAAFPDSWIRQHSLKANDVPGIVARLAARGIGANVVSGGEWALARRAGVPNALTTLEGIGKTPADLAAAVRAAAGGDPLRWVAVESPEELAELTSLARSAGLGGPTGIDVLFRVNPDVTPETHAGLAVGRGSSKFGMSATEITGVVDAAMREPGLPVRPRGVHLHVGSQLGAVDAWRDAVRLALALLALVRGSVPAFDTLDLGGGFPVGPPGAVPDPERFARELPDLVADIPADRRPATWAVEPGRFLVASAGWLVASVLHVRERADEREWGPGRAGSGSQSVRSSERRGGSESGGASGASGSHDRARVVVLDTGMTELLRPALYGARHEIVALTSLGLEIDDASGPSPDAPPSRPDRLALAPARVDGPICESTDTLGVYELPSLRRGDLVAIGDAGAYAASMASAYNGRPRAPQVLLEADGRLVLLRRRGSVNALR
jgi:diaminopimelate decarboxylase